jgi:hypothetical protein
MKWIEAAAGLGLLARFLLIVGQLGGSGEAQEGDSGFGESCSRAATVEMGRATAITATRRGGGVEVWVPAHHRPPRPGSRGAVHGSMRGERVRRRAREQGEGAKLRQSREHGEQSEAR